MIKSMTGYGSAHQTFSTQAATIEIHCEVKTVNSKFIDIQVRSPKSFTSFDPDITRLVKHKLRRGRVDIYISRQVLEGSTQEVHVNMAEAEQLYKALVLTGEKLGLSGKPDFSHLLQQSDWLHTSEIPVDVDEEKLFCLRVLEQALDAVIESRRQEGANLSEVLKTHQTELTKIFSSIENQGPQILKELRRRLSARLKEILAETSYEPQRLEQEIGYWISRNDFQEEVDRFRHHLETFDTLLKAGGEVGRRVEFTVQEMHRELNTMGSKCADVHWTNQIIEMKALVERIREQIQNVE